MDCQRAYECTLNIEYALNRREDTSYPFPGSSIKRSRNIVGSLDVLDLQRHAQRRSHHFQCLHLKGRNRVSEVRQHEDPRDAGNGLLQQAKTLSRKL